jgi:signal transduction histidine kinase
MNVYVKTDNLGELVPAWLDRRIGQHVGSAGITLSQSFRAFCNDFLDFLSKRHKLGLATMWSVNPVRSELILLATAGATVEQLGEPVLDYFTDLNGICLLSKETVEIPDVYRHQEDYGRTFSLKHLITQLDLTRMISVPIINTCSSNQVLLVMNVYPIRDSADPSSGELSQYADWLAPRFEAFLHDHCVRFANRLSIRIGKLKDRYPEKIYALLVQLLSEVIDADAIGIYIEKDDLKGVERKKWAGQDLDGGAASQVDQRATECWERNREFLILSRSESEEIHRGELLPSIPVIQERMQSEVFVPLRDLAGRAKGVFYCIKTTKYPYVSAYTYEDVAVIEAVAQAFTPQLEILLADYQRKDSMNKLAHELRVPVVAFRAALERVERECKAKAYEFQFDHFEELRTYCDVMNRLLKELDVVRQGPHQIPLAPKETHVFSEIIAPAVRFVGPLLKKKRLTHRCIDYGSDLYKTPAFFLDPGMMTEVIFNLLDNAIKYSRDNPNEVKIEISGRDAGDNYEILFSDNGVGVAEGWEERIFDPGVRGPNAYDHDVAGAGLGLWFAREITRRHGGDVVLRNRNDPTVFAMILPNSLRTIPPD